MKPLKTKAQIRAEIEQQISSYLRQGGEVRDIPSGVSGQLDNENRFGHLVRSEPRQERTPLLEVIKQIDARKTRPKKAPAKTSRAPRRKLIKDDFGEPVRWIWEE